MKKHSTFRTNEVAAAAAVFFLTICAARPAADEALDIIRHVDANGKSASSKTEYEMKIKPSDGSATREFSLIAIENDKGDSLIEFSAPRTVRGLRILSKENSSWVYFPSTGRTRKISGSSRSGSVQGVGGDFSYDDLGGDPWETDYSFTLLSSDASSWTLRGARKSGDAAYDEVTLTVDKKLLLPTRAEFLSEKEGGHFKTLELSAFTDYAGRVRAGKMLMKNVKKGSSTEVNLLSATFDMPIDEGLFDPVRIGR